MDFLRPRYCGRIKADLYLEITHRSKESEYAQGMLKCQDFKNVMDSYGPFVEMTSNQYFMPLLKKNPYYEKFMKRLFPDDDVFGPIMRFLFHPRDDIQHEIDKVREKHFSPNTTVIGIQIRRNEAENQITWFRRHHQKYFWECARKEIIDKLPPNRDYKIFIVSDNATVREDAKAEFGDSKVVYYDKPLDFSRHFHAVKNALGDAWLLGYCDEFIVSKWSTFGNLGHGRASKKPWVVQLYNAKSPKAFYWKASSPEPEFHWKNRAERVNCRRWVKSNTKSEKQR